MHSQWLRYANLLGIEVFLAICIFLEKLATAMSKQLVVRHLQFESTVVPGVVEIGVIRVYESELFVWSQNSESELDVSNAENAKRTGCFGSQDILTGNQCEATYHMIHDSQREIHS